MNQLYSLRNDNYSLLHDSDVRIVRRISMAEMWLRGIAFTIEHPMQAVKNDTLEQHKNSCAHPDVIDKIWCARCGSYLDRMGKWRSPQF